MCLQRLREIIADTVKSMNLCVVSPFEHFSSSQSLSRALNSAALMISVALERHHLVICGTAATTGLFFQVMHRLLSLFAQQNSQYVKITAYRSARMFGGGGLLRMEQKTIARVSFLVTSRLKHSGLGCLDIHHNATLMEEAWPAAARVTVVAGG